MASEDCFIVDAFVNTSEPVNFIIRLLYSSFDGISPFELTNNWTGERLTFRQIDKYNWLLVRCPIVREEDKWAKWEKEAIQWKLYPPEWNYITVNFQDSDIGDGMVETNEGPSEEEPAE
uniref:Uncharacterized protein n=1 Tax=Globodera pallida TaxID=36090 RepID=A0A183C680_GLOPA